MLRPYASVRLMRLIRRKRLNRQSAQAAQAAQAGNLNGYARSCTRPSLRGDFFQAADGPRIE